MPTRAFTARSYEQWISLPQREVRPAVGPPTGERARAPGQGIHGRDRPSESGILTAQPS